MSERVKAIDEINEAIYGDGWTMEKAQKALQDMCGIPDILRGEQTCVTPTDAALQHDFPLHHLR